ncbi:MAG: hypothetical protein JO222_00970 [Frankiales bacterium]|nr:hypothetical protein [Frankiales bacterium]
MTALAGGPHSDSRLRDVDSRVAPSTPDCVADVPVLATGTLLLGRQPGSGYVDPPALVHRGDGQVMSLTPLLYAVLEAVDGERSFEDIAAAASGRLGRDLHADDVRTLVDTKLRPLGLVLMTDGSCAEVGKASPLLALRPRVVVSKPELTRRITAPFALLFNPILVVVSTLAFAAVGYWVLFDKGLASAAYDAFQRPGLLLAVFAITVVSAGFHEFGHAAALRRGGGTPGAMGAGLYLIWPAFYTDVTDSYRLSRGARIRTDLGGLYFNALVALGMWGLWLAFRWDGLLLVIAAQILQMVRQLPPLVRFDGYHLLADVTGVPDLFHRIGPTMRSFLPRRWRHAESRALRPWVRVVVTLWVVLVVPLLLVSAVVTVVALPRILGTTWHSLTAQAHLMSLASQHGDITGVLVKALAMLALVVPAGGMVLMIARFGRQVGMRTWRRTAGKPAQRGLAVVTMFAMLTGLAYAWWPHGGNYRPIQPYERGTLADALPAAVTAPSPGLHVGRQASATTMWVNDGQPLPTADHPVLGLVVAPRTGNGPTWVFPFNKPPAPGPGGNQAMAIATQDGSTAYDVAFAMVWADHPTVLNRNEAYAFASCKNCRALAVSFQVVLIVGHANVVAPQNISAAVSYHCLKCLTQALAVQLVVTLPGKVDHSRQVALDKLWAQILVFSHHLNGMSFADIQQQLASYEQQILAIVKPLLPATQNTSLSSASPTPSGTPTPSVAGLAPASASPTAPGASGASGGPSASSSGSPSAGSSASGSPSPSPKPSPSGSAPGSPSPSS